MTETDDGPVVQIDRLDWPTPRRLEFSGRKGERLPVDRIQALMWGHALP